MENARVDLVAARWLGPIYRERGVATVMIEIYGRSSTRPAED